MKAKHPLKKNIAGLWLCLGLLLAALLPSPAAPATRIWTGGEDPFWSNPGNWTNGLIPLAGDAIEFQEEARFRDTYNDLAPDQTIGSILIKGRNYVLRGNRINLQGDLVSQPGNSSNLVTLDLNINSPLSIVNHGYFNVLELSGDIELFWHPLVLWTGSLIRISGYIQDTNNAGTIQRGSGRVEFGTTGRLLGTMIVERGDLLLNGASLQPHLLGQPPSTLVAGNDTDPPGYARVLWGASQKLAIETQVLVNRSGVLDLGSFSQSAASLNGGGTLDLESGRWSIREQGVASHFAGEIRGHGAFRLEGMEAGLTLSGHNSLTGLIELVSRTVTNQTTQAVTKLGSRLHLTGSASNAVVSVMDGSMLSGHGIARALVASNSTVRPGPGTLRFLESASLDDTSTLALDVDGPEAGNIRADSLALGLAALEFTYHGGGTDNLFPLVLANFAGPDSRFHGLPEGAWLVAGDLGGPSEFRLTYAGNAGHDVLLERTGWFVPPTLSIHREAGGERRITWPVAAQGYALQHSLTLDSPAWTTNGLPSPTATLTEFHVIDSTSGSHGFYRLTR